VLHECAGGNGSGFSP